MTCFDAFRGSSLGGEFLISGRMCFYACTTRGNLLRMGQTGCNARTED
jgi:hypothetical protein